MAKTLILYYSLEGNIDFVAQALAKELNADLFRLETVKEYPKKGLAKYFHGGKDVVLNSCPELKSLPESIAPYELIVLGTPVWASRPASPLNTVFANIDFSGKKVAAFASSASGNNGKTFEVISEKLKNATLGEIVSFKNPCRSPEIALETIKSFAEKLGGVTERMLP